MVELSSEWLKELWSKLEASEFAPADEMLRRVIEYENLDDSQQAVKLWFMHYLLQKPLASAEQQASVLAHFVSAFTAWKGIAFALPCAIKAIRTAPTCSYASLLALSEHAEVLYLDGQKYVSARVARAHLSILAMCYSTFEFYLQRLIYFPLHAARALIDEDEVWVEVLVAYAETGDTKYNDHHEVVSLLRERLGDHLSAYRERFRESLILMESDAE